MLGEMAPRSARADTPYDASRSVRRHVVVDGSNIATEGRETPSLAQLDEAVQAYMAQYGPEIVTVVVDASFPNRIARTEQKVYEAAVVAGEIITPPAGAIGRGDAFILQIADRADATILSNDSFQEFHGLYDWLFDHGRLVGGKPVPHVGWVFMDRTPVRGPLSRRSVSAAKATKAPKAAPVDTTGPPSGDPLPTGRAAKSSRAGKGAAAAGAAGAGAEVEPSGRRAKAAKAAPTAPDGAPSGRAAKATKASKAAKSGRGGVDPQAGAGGPGGAGDASKPGKGGEAAKVGAGVAAKASRGAQATRKAAAEPAAPAAPAKAVPSAPANDALPFIEFVGAHPVGGRVTGVVEQFSSHGAYVRVGAVQAYAPLKYLADPAPRSAKKVLRLGESREFVVVSVDGTRRGIDLALPGIDTSRDDAPAAPPVEAPPAKKATPRKAAGSKAAGKAAAKAPAAKKQAAKKQPAKQATAAKKTAAKKTVAKKAAAAKGAAKKASAGRSGR